MIVRNEKPEILLTFDDGPTDLLVDLLLILKTEQVQGLFFWLSDSLKEGENYKRLVEEGHELGVHGRSHGMYTELSYAEQWEQMVHAKITLGSRIGRTITWFRPPYGLYNQDTKTVCKSLGLNMVLWQVTSWDWMHPTEEEKIVENIVTHVRPGDLILLHELPQTIRVLPTLITSLRDQGFQLSKPFSPLRLLPDQGK